MTVAPVAGGLGPLILGDIARITGGVFMPGSAADTVVRGVAIDSRVAREGDLFVALPGERVDGHQYVAQAVLAGAAALVDRPDALPAELPPDAPVVVVGDAAEALVALATHLHRALRAAGTRTIAVTGSNGKTTTKDLIAHVLAADDSQPTHGLGARGPLVFAPGSYNNEIGLPLTVIRAALAPVAPRHLVLEMGARGVGHIAALCRIAPPDVGVVLMVGSAHLSEFGSRDNLARAKAELVQAVTSDGVSVLNADDALVAAMSVISRGSVVTFGTQRADVVATEIELDDQARARFVLTHGGHQAGVSLPVPGAHHVANALAAAAVALVEGMTVASVAALLSEPMARSPHRMALTHRDDGVSILDDAYNANPESMAAALQSLAVIGRGRRTWAVLGEMLELGEETLEAHDRIGRLAVRLNVSQLVAVGPGARVVHLAAAQEGSWGGESVWVADVESAADLLAGQLLPGDVVLVKASNAVGLWRLADQLLAGLGTAAVVGGGP